MFKNNKHVPNEQKRGTLTTTKGKEKLSDEDIHLQDTLQYGCYTDIQTDKGYLLPVAQQVRTGATLEAGLLPAAGISRWMCGNFACDTIQAA